MSWLLLHGAVLIALILLCAFFSSSEVALTGLSLHQLNEIKRRRSKLLRFWEDHPDKILATLLLSNTAIHIAVGIWAANVTFDLSRRWPHATGLIATLTSLTAAVVILYAGEIIPKVLARQWTEPWALLIAVPLRLWAMLVSPIATFSIWCARLLGLEKILNERYSPFEKEAELKKVWANAAIPPVSRKLLDNVVDFSSTSVQDVMVPRDKISAVCGLDPLPKIVERVVQLGFSRVPVTGKSPNDIIGVLYAKDLLVAWRAQTLVVLEDLLRPVYAVEPTTPLSALLRSFQSGRQHMAVVKKTDEHGTAQILGLLTLQDALEAIVGPIREEE